MPAPTTALTVPPGPLRIPVVGNTVQYRRNRLRFLESMHARYGESVTVHFGSVPVFLFSREDTVRTIFSGKVPLVSRDAVKNVRFLLGDSLRPSDLFASVIKACCGCMHERAMLASDGEEHWDQRRGANPNPTLPEMDAFVGAMTRVARQVTAHWADGAVVDVHESMREVSLRIVAGTLFGVEERIDTLMPAFTTILSYNTGSWLGSAAAARTYRAAWMEIEREIDSIIADHQSGRKQATIGLRGLFDDSAASGVFPRDRVKHYVFQMLGMGHATTASALTFALLLLAKHPSIAAQARAEVDAVRGGEGVTARALPDLKLVEMVALETLRLFPVIWGQARVATEDVVLEGYRLPRGSFAIVSPWIVHRSAANFPKPLEFDPWRFEATVDGALPPEAFRPFGSGPHKCIGDKFALLEMKTVLATILREIEFVDQPATVEAWARTLILEPKSPPRLRIRRLAETRSTAARTYADVEEALVR